MKTNGMEKRQFKRGPLQIPIHFTMHEVSREGYMTNLSAGGCLLFCYSPLSIKVGQPIRISFDLKNSPDKINLIGQVIRVEPFVYNPDYGKREQINQVLGIKFLDLFESQKQAIEGYNNRVLTRMKKD